MRLRSPSPPLALIPQFPATSLIPLTSTHASRFTVLLLSSCCLSCRLHVVPCRVAPVHSLTLLCCLPLLLPSLPLPHRFRVAMGSSLSKRLFPRVKNVDTYGLLLESLESELTSLAMRRSAKHVQHRRIVRSLVLYSTAAFFLLSAVLYTLDEYTYGRGVRAAPLLAFPFMSAHRIHAPPSPHHPPCMLTEVVLCCAGWVMAVV